MSSNPTTAKAVRGQLRQSKRYETESADLCHSKQHLKNSNLANVDNLKKSDTAERNNGWDNRVRTG